MNTVNERQRGFTLLELMVVLVIIAIIAAIAIPNLLASKSNANETAAIATLKTLFTGQNQLRASGVIDANKNGTGEYGYFTELSGRRPVRTGVPPDVLESTDRVSPPTMSPAFGQLHQVGPYGYVQRSGYFFVVSLPRGVGNFAPEPYYTTPYWQVNPTLAEGYWMCHAWPAAYHSTGRRIFFIDQTGVVLQAQNEQTKYSGTKNLIALPGVLLPGKTLMTDTVAVNTLGNDGNRWTIVQ